MAALLVSTFLAFTNYAALLPVVPMWASRGGASDIAIGGATGVMMAATVATQLAMPWLFRRLSLRSMMVLGSVLLALPTPVYALTADVMPIMLITVVRGIGFAFVVVAGAALVPDLARPGRLATSASAYGVAAALPNLGALAGGLWAAERWGYPLLFAAVAATGLAGALVARTLPGAPRGMAPRGQSREIRRVAAPLAVLLLVASAFGAMTTFLPHSGPDAGLTGRALLVASAALIAARLAAGVVGDRCGAGRLVIVAAAAAVLGCLLIAWSAEGSARILLLGAALVGAGFGACQNDTLVLVMERLGATRGGTASTWWNIVYDGGLGLGAVCFGMVVGELGHAGGFLTIALGVALVAVVCAVRLPVGRARNPARGVPCAR